MTFNKQYALYVLGKLIAAVPVTLVATGGGMLLALMVGLLFAVARFSSVRVIAMLAGGIVEFIRSTPLLIQLFFLYYVLPRYGLSLSAYAAGIIGLGLHYGTYTSEVYRSGISSIPRGQWEAAIALSLDPWTKWVRIILPQAIPPIIPALGNYLVAMFKETPLLATITVQEILGVAIIETSKTFRYFEPMTLVGLLFLAMSYLSAFLIRRLERRFSHL
jgi:polar amino acid transport system permease protein